MRRRRTTQRLSRSSADSVWRDLPTNVGAHNQFDLQQLRCRVSACENAGIRYILSSYQIFDAKSFPFKHIPLSCYLESIQCQNHLNTTNLFSTIASVDDLGTTLSVPYYIFTSSTGKKSTDYCSVVVLGPMLWKENYHLVWPYILVEIPLTSTRS